jgi:hypothetical protein
MEPGRAARDDLEAARRDAQRAQQRQHVRLGVEGVHGLPAPVPMAADALGPGGSAPHGGGLDGLAFRLVGREGLADLEQGHVAEPAVGVALRRPHQARQQARTHVGEIRRDGVGQRQPPVAAAEQPGLLPGDEGPGDGLHQPAHGKRPAGEARALLDQGQDGLGHHVFQARQGLGRDAVEAGDADDLLDQIRLALDVGPPGRGRDRDALAGAFEGKAQLPQDPLGFGGLHVETGQARNLGPGELDDAPLLGRPPATRTSPASPPHRSTTMRVASSRPGTAKADRPRARSGSGRR